MCLDSSKLFYPIISFHAIPESREDQSYSASKLVISNFYGKFKYSDL